MYQHLNKAIPSRKCSLLASAATKLKSSIYVLNLDRDLPSKNYVYLNGWAPKMSQKYCNKKNLCKINIYFQSRKLVD